MTSMTFVDLPLAQIDIPQDRARSYDAASAEALAAIIADQGLMHPITVLETGDRFELVAGMHRLAAFRMNGAETIPARVTAAATSDEARLQEVMENLGRAELTALDRCQHLFELKRAWEASRARPLVEVLVGAGGKSFPTSDDGVEIFGFARSVAEKVGLSKRAINMAVKIWEALAPTVRTRLIGTGLARKQTELKALSELEPKRQQKVLDLILDEDSEASNVASALAVLDAGAGEDAGERKVVKLAQHFGSLPDLVFDRVLAENEERVIASLKRRGRI